jgi:methylmalonyl-CoA mutase C-terminal domain/subunit
MKAVTAKIGLDGHFRGIKFVTRVLRDAGVEVVYLGFHNSAEQVARVVVDEDAHLLALSFLSPEGATDVHVIIGGLVDPHDGAELKTLGVDRIFGPETKASQITDYLAEQFGDEPVVHPPVV